MSDTPRTVEAVLTFNEVCDVPVSSAEFAKLERELAAVRAELAAIQASATATTSGSAEVTFRQAAIDDLNAAGDALSGETEILRLNRELANMTADRDSWRDQNEQRLQNCLGLADDLAAAIKQLAEIDRILGKRGHDAVAAAKDRMQDLQEAQTELAALAKEGGA